MALTKVTHINLSNIFDSITFRRISELSLRFRLSLYPNRTECSSFGPGNTIRTHDWWIKPKSRFSLFVHFLFSGCYTRSSFSAHRTTNESTAAAHIHLYINICRATAVQWQKKRFIALRFILSFSFCLSLGRGYHFYCSLSALPLGMIASGARARTRQ